MSKGKGDDFDQGTKDLLAKRVGHQCSLPRCRLPTSGPHSNPGKSVNVGVAAHITAARPSGARYDPHITPEQRRGHANGIWACQNHAKLIDDDPDTYTVEQLRAWKAEAEERVRRAQEGKLTSADEAREFRELRRWWNSFVGTPCEFSGRMVYLAWRGPLEELEPRPPRDVTGDELVAIHCAICRYDLGQLVQPGWQGVHAAAQVEVWELDEQRTEKRKLRSAHLVKHDVASCLVVRHRREPCLPFCARCGRTVGSGTYCRQCGEDLQQPVLLRHC